MPLIGTLGHEIEEEGPRLTSNVVGASYEELAVGMAVEVVFDDVTETITLPRFRPR